MPWLLSNKGLSGHIAQSFRGELLPLILPSEECSETRPPSDRTKRTLRGDASDCLSCFNVVLPTKIASCFGRFTGLRLVSLCVGYSGSLVGCACPAALADLLSISHFAPMLFLSKDKLGDLNGNSDDNTQTHDYADIRRGWHCDPEGITHGRKLD